MKNQQKTPWGGVNLLIFLLALAACQPDVVEQDMADYRAIEEKVPTKNISQQIRYEMETLSFYSQGNESSDPDYRKVPQAQRLDIQMILDKDQRVWIDIEMLEPSRGQQFRKKEDWYEAHAINRMQLMDNQMYSYDKAGKLVSNQQIDASQMLLDWQLGSKEELSAENFGLLRVKPHQMSPIDIDKKAKLKGQNYQVLNEDNFVLSSNMEMGATETGRGAAVEVKEYYVSNTGLLKGVEIKQGDIPLFRSAYSYRLNGDSYELQRIYAESYQYDEQDQLDGKVISNTYFKIKN